MAVFDIRLFGDPVLRRRAPEVEEVDDSVRKLIQDMMDTMRNAPGVGLAAPQIGISRRVIVWEYEGESGALVNPAITRRSESVTADEGCLSLPGLAYPVERARVVAVTGLDSLGSMVELQLEDMLARIIQHEVDHIDGILFIDRLPSDLRKEAMRELRSQTLAATEDD